MGDEKLSIGKFYCEGIEVGNVLKTDIIVNENQKSCLEKFSFSGSCSIDIIDKAEIKMRQVKSKRLKKKYYKRTIKYQLVGD